MSVWERDPRHREQDSGRDRDPRRLLRGLLWFVGAWLLVTAGTVFALRFVPPPTSAVMWLEPGPLGDVDYRFTPRAAISEAAARAAIAADRYFGVPAAEHETEIDDDERPIRSLCHQVRRAAPRGQSPGKACEHVTALPKHFASLC